MTRPLAVGDMIHGHVAGWLGRDFYQCARIEDFGADWVVVRYLGRAHAVAVPEKDGPWLHAELIRARDYTRDYCDHERGSADASNPARADV